jgi:hypothetical protein
MAVKAPPPEEKRGPGRPRTPGKEPLADPRHELFCITYVSNGWKRSAAYANAYGTSGKSAKEGSNRILRRPEIQQRLRYLLRQQGEARVTQAGIQKDAIDGRMWSVIERCMQHEKVETPTHLKGRFYEPCPTCSRKDTESQWCARCKRNQKLFDEWKKFGGVYKFDPRGAVQALLPLGRDRGLYIDKKLIGHMDGDDIIDAMNDKEVRELVRSLATEVGLRVVEARSESSDGSPAEQGPHLQAVS